MSQFLDWWRQHGSWQWIAHGFQVLMVGGLVLAIVLVTLAWFEQRSALTHLRAQQQEASAIMVVANTICEARLDRLQGIMQAALVRDDERLRQCQAMCEPAALAPPPEEP